MYCIYSILWTECALKSWFYVRGRVQSKIHDWIASTVVYNARIRYRTTIARADHWPLRVLATKNSAIAIVCAHFIYTFCVYNSFNSSTVNKNSACTHTHIRYNYYKISCKQIARIKALIFFSTDNYLYMKKIISNMYIYSLCIRVNDMCAASTHPHKIRHRLWISYFFST